MNRQIGVRDFKYVGEMPPTHRSRDRAHDTLSRSVGQLDRKQKYGGHSAYPMQKSTENVLKSRNIVPYKEIWVKESNVDVRISTGS